MFSNLVTLFVFPSGLTECTDTVRLTDSEDDSGLKKILDHAP